MTTVTHSHRSRRAAPWLLSTCLCLCLATMAGGTTAEAAQQRRATPDIVDATRTDGPAVALTFDDGPNPVDTPRLLEVLREHEVTAVFCLWGDHVEQHPEIVRAIAADGHVLCNHSMHHDDMGTWSRERIRQDLNRTSAAIRRAVPGARIPYFRAPYGSWGETPQVAAQLGMQPLGWRLAVGDWEPTTADELVTRLREGLTYGSVVLLHDGGGDRSPTVEAVDRIIPELKAEGWYFDLPATAGTTCADRAQGTWQAG